MAHRHRFGADQGRRKSWPRLALWVGVALAVVCLLISDRVDCRPKEDEGSKEDDSDKSKDSDTAATKDGGDDDDERSDQKRKDDKVSSKKTAAEKKLTEGAGEDKSSAKDDGEVESKSKGGKKSSSKKAVKETKVATKVTTTTTTSAPTSAGANSTFTTAHKKGGRKHGKAHHRVSGGYQESYVPSYLATLWQPPQMRPTADGRYVGNGILVGDGKMLIHSESKSRLDEDPNKQIMEDVVFDSPQTINTDGVSHREKYRDLEAVKTGIGGSPFGLYTIKNKAPITIPGYPELPRTYPTLEHDYNNFGKDCNAYGWSRDLGAASPEAAGGGSMQHRPFVSFPVEHDPGSCHNGHCELSSDYGSICDGLADYGVPVLCGKKKVLTYIIKGIDAGSDGSGCRRGNIPAFHVGSMVDELKNHVPELSHTGF